VVPGRQIMTVRDQASLDKFLFRDTHPKILAGKRRFLFFEGLLREKLFGLWYGGRKGRIVGPAPGFLG